MHLEVKDFLRDRLYKFRFCMFVFVLLLVVFVFSNLVGGLMPLESLWCVAVALTLTSNNQIAALAQSCTHQDWLIQREPQRFCLVFGTFLRSRPLLLLLFWLSLLSS
jgi:hypothetical protein